MASGKRVFVESFFSAPSDALTTVVELDDFVAATIEHNVRTSFFASLPAL